MQFSQNCKLLDTVHNNYTKSDHVFGWIDKSWRQNTRYDYIHQQKSQQSDANRNMQSYRCFRLSLVSSYYSGDNRFLLSFTINSLESWHCVGHIRASIPLILNRSWSNTFTGPSDNHCQVEEKFPEKIHVRRYYMWSRAVVVSQLDATY